MLQRLQKDLKSLLCKREQWQKDKDHCRCQCCGKAFTLFRRRHHCRFCGKIFCSSCSNYFLNGRYFCQDEQYVRHCQFCKQAIEGIKRKCKKVAYSYAQSEPNASQFSDDEQQQQDVGGNMFSLTASTIIAFETNLEQEADLLLRAICKQIRDAYDLRESVLVSLMECVRRAAKEAQMFEGEDNMSVLRRVRVQCVNNLQPSLSLVRGIVLPKTTVCRRMLTRIRNPRILLFAHSIDIDALPTMSFADLVTNSHQQLIQFLQLIMGINPDVIFVGQNVNFEALEWFKERKVAIFNNIAAVDLQDIANLVGVKKIIKNVSQVGKYKYQNIIGTCDEIYLKQFEEYKTLLFIEKEAGIRSLLVSELTKQRQMQMESAVCFLLKYCNQINLEMQILLLQAQIIRLNKLNKDNILKFASAYHSIKCFLDNEKISYVKIAYTSVTLSQSEFQYALETQYVKEEMEEVCGEVSVMEQIIYCKDDITIGSFVLQQAMKQLIICERCSSTHSFILYFSTHAVSYKVTAAETQGEITMHFICCNKCQPSHKITLTSTYLKNSFYNFLALLKKPMQCEMNSIIKRVITSNRITLEIQTFQFITYKFDPVDYRTKESKQTAKAIRTKYLTQKIHQEGNSQLQIIEIIKQICGQMIDNMTCLGDSQSELNRINEISDLISKIHSCLEQIIIIINDLLHKEPNEFDWTKSTYKLNENTQILCSIIIILKTFRQVQSQPITQYATQIQHFRRTEISEEQKKYEIVVQVQTQEQGFHPINRFQQIDIKIDECQQTIIKGFLQRAHTQRYPAREKKEKKTILQSPIAWAKDPVSVLGCALNSPQFMQFHASGSGQEQLSMKLRFTKKIHIENMLGEEIEKRIKEDKGELLEIVVHCHQQFEELRVLQGLQFEQYVSSLCSCTQWKTSGGKTNSPFSRSHDQLLVVKTIKEKEFLQFKKFTKEYLKFMKVARLQGRESVLTKVLGVYEVTMKGKTKHCIVMQNVFFGVVNALHTYDLKGSEVNRLVSQGKTGLDTNFKIDRRGRPYVIEHQNYQQFINSIQNDVLFLKNQAVIDYSLLLIESPEGILRASIIDFMRPYHLFEKIQNLIKQTLKAKMPTVIPPQAYANRFIAAINKYFIEI